VGAENDSGRDGNLKKADGLDGRTGQEKRTGWVSEAFQFGGRPTRAVFGGFGKATRDFGESTAILYAECTTILVWLTDFYLRKFADLNDWSRRKHLGKLDHSSHLATP
jgi:hypothetical protein